MTPKDYSAPETPGEGQLHEGGAQQETDRGSPPPGQQPRDDIGGDGAEGRDVPPADPRPGGRDRKGPWLGGG